ncbi:MAG: hypothetical protein AAB425_09105 [Bdellovibrionota bacterium]
MMTKTLISLALVLLLTTGSFVRAAPPAAGAALQETLKKSVLGAADQLGALESWQKDLWAEVVEGYALFVRDYRAAASGVQVDVDVDAIRNYLAFSAPKVLKRDDYRFLVWVRPAKDCDECKAASEPIRNLLKLRFTRRGLKPWLVANPLKELPPLKWFWADSDLLTGQAFETELLKLLQEKNLAGAAFVSIDRELPPPDDTAHADEIHFVTKTFFIARSGNEPVRRERVTIHQGKLDTRDPSALTDQLSRLTTDALIDWGAQAESIATGAEGPARFELSITGIPDFARYLGIRSKIEAALYLSLKDLSGFVERKMWRGGVVFGFQTQKPIDAVKAALSGLALEPGNLAIVDVEQDRILKAEVR